MAGIQKSLDDAYAYCRKLTIEADSNFALGFQFLPVLKQNSIYAVYAFNRLADDMADEEIEGDSRLKSLERWDSLLDRCYEGKLSDNPVMFAFTDTIERFSIPKKPFKDAIEGFKMDLKINRYMTFEDLKLYCDRVAGTISVMSLHIFGWSDAKAFEHGANLSYALQLTNIIRDVGRDIDKNRIYIPLDEIRDFGYTEEELLSRTVNENFNRLMRFQIKRAKEYFKKATPLISLVHKDSRYTVTLIGAVYAYLLKKIVDQKIPVFDTTVSLNKMEKLKLAAKMRVKPTFII